MGYEEHAFDVDPLQEGPQAGPSWASSRWPVTDPGAGDDLTRALDPMALKVEIAKAKKTIQDANKKAKAAYSGLFSKISVYDDKAVAAPSITAASNPRVRRCALA